METTIKKITEICQRVWDEMQINGIDSIPSFSYKLRESGENMLYFSKSKDDFGKTYLVPQPIKSQKEYYDFFNETAPGAKLFPRYTVYLYKDDFQFREHTKTNGKMSWRTVC